MLDVDGVLVVHPDPGGWSARLEQDLGIDPAVLDAQRDPLGGLHRQRRIGGDPSRQLQRRIEHLRQRHDGVD